jgi:hypothetical protein
MRQTCLTSGGGTFETCPPSRECPFAVVDRKSQCSGKNDANDPERTWHLFLHPSNTLPLILCSVGNEYGTASY